MHLANYCVYGIRSCLLFRALEGIYLDALGACVYGKLLGNQSYEEGSYDVG